MPLTFKSVVAQTEPPAQWLIVDDGSRDATPDLAARYAAEYPWIRLVRRERAGGRQLGPGVVAAFNAGLSQVENEPYEVIV